MFKKKKFVISAPHSGSGKTTVTLGLLLALKQRNLSVRSYKIGPDFIDSSYQSAICQQPSINLDGFLLNEEQLLTVFTQYDTEDIAIVEGVMGLYDGLGASTIASTAHVASIIQAPIILVIDARGMASSVAALVLGFQQYQQANICGVIFNRVQSQSHFLLLKSVIEQETNVACLGFLMADDTIEIPSRHLGLLPAESWKHLDTLWERLRINVEANIDIERLLTIQSTHIQPQQTTTIATTCSCTIAIAMDDAFLPSFYYHDNLALMTQLGARLVFFSTLSDTRLPECDGIYITGGFPELFSEQLEENSAMRDQIRDFAKKNKPILAECGGYMYLSNSIQCFDDRSYSMCDVFHNVSTIMHTKRSKQFGYVYHTLTQDTCIGKTGLTYRTNEFHHSQMVGNGLFAYKAKKASTGKEWVGGSVYKNCFGTQGHFYFRNDLQLLTNFLTTCTDAIMSDGVDMN